MSGGLLLTRARLSRDSTVAALLPVLLQSHSDHATPHAGHALIWSLFADTPDRRRDFLWRDMGGRSFMILSERLPNNERRLFEVDPPKPFAPVLKVGDRLGFSLRSNPVRRRLREGRKLSDKHDVVMDALRLLSKDDRAAERQEVIRSAGFAWLAAQGARHGFAVAENEVAVEGYQQHNVPREARPPITFSTIDYDGLLTVTDPDAFLEKLPLGFGAAKAFGCGLMLLRRV